MTPEQIDRIETTLFDRIFQWRRGPMADARQRHADAIADREAFTQVVAEHVAMKESLRWRKQSEEPAPADEFVVERRAHCAPCCCFGHEVEADSEWLPVPP